ncbi:amidohydrolase family protein [Halomonas dongshanensis]|uniref:Amidohydrolase family protein n=1 Tax=Halomonas dongshanensis TaxID=2890835 RepID=A0ABT2EDN0_9GAMM|nr:amidohydrolase family protein [Halomonas dongshanensis]MCS2609706.1 amidohydrolase family protein [Halomonas dongshanensis]
MIDHLSFSRRQLLGGMAVATGTSLLPGAYAHAATRAASSSATASASASEQPQRFCIRNATVLTMEPGQTAMENTDVWVVDGRIEAVGQGLAAEGAESIDGRGCIVMPGLVDTHNHMWQTQMRGMFAQREGALFFPLTNRLAEHFRPEDTWVGEYLAAMENVSAGITTSNDFFDNNRNPEHSAAALEALAHSPLRARLLLGNESKTAKNGIDLERLRELNRGWEGHSENGRLSLGLAWRLPEDLDDLEAMAMKRREYDTARELELPIAVHVSGEAHHAMFARLVEGEFLHPSVQVVHATDARGEHLDALNAAGASVALTPITEHRVAYGLTRLSHFAAVERLGLGIDGNALAGSADMFAVMRTAALTEIAASGDQTAVDCQALLALATSRAAESIGLGDQIGTLTPGKQADVIMLDTRALNLGMLPSDPAALLVFAATPANVSLVAVQGRIAKRDGHMVGLDSDELQARVTDSLDHLRQYLA